MEAKLIREMVEAYASVYDQDLNEKMMPTPLPSKDPVKMQKPQPKPDHKPRDVKRGPVIKSMGEQSVFDIIKGHLLDEGYADTEQAALAIMANMSEEWKQSIIEVMVVTDADRKGGTEAAKRLQQGKPGYKAGPGYNFEKGPVQLRLPGV